MNFTKKINLSNCFASTTSELHSLYKSKVVLICSDDVACTCAPRDKPPQRSLSWRPAHQPSECQSPSLATQRTVSNNVWTCKALCHVMSCFTSPHLWAWPTTYTKPLSAPCGHTSQAVQTVAVHGSQIQVSTSVNEHESVGYTRNAL